MYLRDEPEQMHGWLSKAAKKVRKAVKKVAKKAAPIALPVYAMQTKAAKRGVKKVAPLLRKSLPIFAPVAALTSSPKKFAAIGTSIAVPRASVPAYDYEGDDMTQEERTAIIDAGQGYAEPIASGYPSQEEVYEPDVPELVSAEDVPPLTEPAKKSALPWLGGALILLNFLS